MKLEQQFDAALGRVCLSDFVVFVSLEWIEVYILLKDKIQTTI